MADMTPEEHRDARVVIDRLMGALNDHDLDRMVALFHPDYDSRQPAHPVREQVTTAVRSFGQERERVLGLGELAEGDDAGLGARGTQTVGDLDSLVRVVRGHADVRHHHVRLVLSDRALERREILTGCDDFEVVLLLEQPENALAHEVVVLGQDDADRHLCPRSMMTAARCRRGSLIDGRTTG